MKNYLAIAATLLLASCAATGGVPAFSKLDADGDDRISREEAANSDELMAVFHRADANGDGDLDRAEYDGARQLIDERNRRERDHTRDRGHQPRRH